MAVSGYGKTSSKQYFLCVNREALGAMLIIIGCFYDLWKLESITTKCLIHICFVPLLLTSICSSLILSLN